MSFADPVTGAETVVDDIVGLVSKYVPDKEKAAELAEQIREKTISAAQASDQTQATIMAAEAAQKGWFNKPHLAGAWLCLIAISLDLLIGQATWLSYALGHPFPEPPKFLGDQLGTMMSGLFSLGGITVLHQGYKQWMASP